MGIGEKARNFGKIAEGKTKEKLGHALGNEHMQWKGTAEKIKGKMKHAAEKARDTLKH
ncbi:CsbD family protein [Streptomyces gilvosporeus]|uniref:CsbD family protein n=1 Tax=Streptomyces gilvosporeus TaxID=553510 RepID=A0A1V0TLV8_9ACTN|nr:CsbD family protein [Streptomyces gilvosporeus]ARF53925.1 CsbD family protein [Streptomyces gilvosporeus]